MLLCKKKAGLGFSRKSKDPPLLLHPNGNRAWALLLLPKLYVGERDVSLCNCHRVILPTAGCGSLSSTAQTCPCHSSCQIPQKLSALHQYDLLWLRVAREVQFPQILRPLAHPCHITVLTASPPTHPRRIRQGD